MAKLVEFAQLTEMSNLGAVGLNTHGSGPVLTLRALLRGLATKLRPLTGFRRAAPLNLIRTLLSKE